MLVTARILVRVPGQVATRGAPEPDPGLNPKPYALNPEPYTLNLGSEPRSKTGSMKPEIQILEKGSRRGLNS